MPHPLVLGPLSAVPVAAIVAFTVGESEFTDDRLENFLWWYAAFALCLTWCASAASEPGQRLVWFETLLLGVLALNTAIVTLFATGPLGLILVVPIGAVILIARRRR